MAHSTEHMREIGQRGGRAKLAAIGLDGMAEMGKRGAAARKVAGVDYAAMGDKGGVSTKEKMLAKDPDYYRKIAAKSWETRREKAAATGQPMTGTNGGRKPGSKPKPGSKSPAVTLKAKYGADYYKRIGKQGGDASVAGMRGDVTERTESAVPVQPAISMPATDAPWPKRSSTLSDEERAALDAKWAALTRRSND